jgi:hypothetical protein
MEIIPFLNGKIGQRRLKLTEEEIKTMMRMAIRLVEENRVIAYLKEKSEEAQQAQVNEAKCKKI